MISQTVVELSLWQFAITAMLHFLFIPLTLGLALLLALMESAFVWTGRSIYKEMAQLWGRIFAINLVLAISTRVLVACQFGMNGSYFSHYVGDIFAIPLAIEALSSCFVVAVFFGPYWFGWEKLGKYQHVLVTWVIAVAINVSSYWILLANGWLQNPVAASFNHLSYRMELNDFASLLINPAALAKYVHTVAASYVTAAGSLLAISAFWLLKKQDDELAGISFRWAAGMGLISILFTVGFGDGTVSLTQPVQQLKQAVIHAQPKQNLLLEVEARIRSGSRAYALLQDLRDDNKDPQIAAEFDQHKADLGYAWLLMPWHKSILGANQKQISLAAQSALPPYPNVLFWTYRLMIACGIVSLVFFLLIGWQSATQKSLNPRLLSWSIYFVPIPWIACVAGWFVAEIGKQPWTIAGVLPSFLSISTLSVSQLVLSGLGYALTGLTLLIAGLYLLRNTICSRVVNVQGGQ